MASGMQLLQQATLGEDTTDAVAEAAEQSAGFTNWRQAIQQQAQVSQQQVPRCDLAS
jgi:hypothetical protein